MDEQAYLKIADATFARIENMFEDVDAADVDCERAGDVITLTFRNRKKCIVNTQRPTRQIWLAAGVNAWHFVYDDAGARWLDEKGTAAELISTIARVVKEQAGVDIVAS
jgi:CyaY protein